MYTHGVWDSQMCPVYRGVLISGCPELGVPLYSKMFLQQRTIGTVCRSSHHGQFFAGIDVSEHRLLQAMEVL